MAKYYVKCDIYPDTSVPGWFLCEPRTDRAWTCVYGLIADVERDLRDITVYLFGYDDTPRKLPDIRGRIKNEPTYVLGWVNKDGTPGYVGVSEFDDGNGEVAS